MNIKDSAKIISVIAASLVFAGTTLWAQDFEPMDFSDEALFGSADDEFFGSSDDDLFGDDSIVQIEDTHTSGFSDALNHGALYENGSIKIGGNFDMELDLQAVLYQDSENTLADNLTNSTLTPKASAYLTVDARPTQNLRMFTKFGFAYPFVSTANSTAVTKPVNLFADLFNTTVETNVSDYIQPRELFTDFSVADRLYFRFGKHTVSWGTGYFFSPVSDMINTSSINPEDVDAEIHGSFNLRAQLTFPGTQNCLWFYVIPSTDFVNQYSTATYLKDTGFAVKGDILVHDWELGFGGYWKYQGAPKLMATASGSIFGKVNVFAETVWQYGTNTQWKNDESLNDKDNIFLLTAGATYYWKTPQILAALQIFYDGFNQKDLNLLEADSSDLVHNYFTKGTNIAGAVNFGRVFGTTDVSATVFGLVNFGKEEIPDMGQTYLGSYGIGSFLNAGTFSALLNWTPFKNFTFGGGPYITFQNWNSKPTVSLKLNAKFGGGKF